jgi:hypothetical protein
VHGRISRNGRRVGDGLGEEEAHDGVGPRAGGGGGGGGVGVTDFL